jgi:hypothetical protein
MTAGLAGFLALWAIAMSSAAVASSPPDMDPVTRSILEQVHFPVPMKIELWLMQNSLPIGIVLLAASLLGLIASVQLLRLRSWARPLLERLSWFAIVWILALRSLRVASQLVRLRDSPVEPMLILAQGSLLFVIFALPFAVLIFLLRSRGVRESLVA